MHPKFKSTIIIHECIDLNQEQVVRTIITKYEVISPEYLVNSDDPIWGHINLIHNISSQHQGSCHP